MTFHFLMNSTNRAVTLVVLQGNIIVQGPQFELRLAVNPTDLNAYIHSVVQNV